VASGNVFATWLWASRWWHHYGHGRQLLLAALRRPGAERRALLPLLVWRDGPLRIARFVGYGTADELGPVCAPRDRPAAARAVLRLLTDAGVDVLLGEHLRGGAGWSAMLGGASVLRREGFPLLRAPDGWEGYVATRSSHFRHKIAGLERRLGRHRDLRYRLADDPARLDQDLDLLFALHRARWVGGSEFLAHQDFHRDLARAAFHQGWLRLWFLELDGVAVAAWYGFRFCGVESHFQSGRDPRFERESPGTVLLAHTIKAALDDGVTEYRFLRGGEAYKHRFATDDPGLETAVIARGAAGRSALTGARAVDAVPQLRRLLRRGVAS
jgi:CelD/BcsL family acetyltransferase involved in cellulose biosynthesis